jgi:hypothetical protein
VAAAVCEVLVPEDRRTKKCDERGHIERQMIAAR